MQGMATTLLTARYAPWRFTVHEWGCTVAQRDRYSLPFRLCDLTKTLEGLKCGAATRPASDHHATAHHGGSK